jgi:hypothetical protein
MQLVPPAYWHYKTAPTQTSPIIIAQGKGTEIRLARWAWSRDLSLATRVTAQCHSEVLVLGCDHYVLSGFVGNSK